jgi:hypothetical protein
MKPKNGADGGQSGFEAMVSCGRKKADASQKSAVGSRLRSEHACCLGWGM